MTTIFDAKNKKIYDISIMYGDIHIEGDILGNMNICSDGTGIYRVSQDWDDGNGSVDDKAAFDAGCTYYGDAESVQWWVTYVNGYNVTLDDIESARGEIADSDKSAEAIAADLEVKFGIRGYQDDATAAIIEWLQDSQVDYEDERAAFCAKLEELRAAL